MSILIQLRRHIKSIQTTKKITYAMRLISISLYAKVEKHNASLTHYRQTINALTGNIAAIMPDWQNNILFPTDILNSTPLILLVASSKGLCGGFNNNLMRYYKRYCFIEEHQKPIFITIGQKATNHVVDEKLGTIARSYNDFSSNTVDAIVKDIVAHLQEKNSYSSITLYSNYFKNFFTQPPQKTVLTPVDRTTLEKTKTSSFENFTIEDSDSLIWEQSPSIIVDYLALLYLQSSLLHALYQSLIAEQAARFIAMDSATSNAEKMLEKLTLDYNKSRQALITKELSELSASAF